MESTTYKPGTFSSGLHWKINICIILQQTEWDCTLNTNVSYNVQEKKLYSTYLLDELLNNLDNMFVKLMEEKR